MHDRVLVIRNSKFHVFQVFRKSVCVAYNSDASIIRQMFPNAYTVGAHGEVAF